MAQTRTWNGSISSDWNDPDNWTPAGVPSSGTVNINNAAVPNPCVLDDDRTITTLNVNSGASLNFNGYSLIVTGTSTINNAVLTSTNLTSSSLSGFSWNIFNGATVLIKTGNSNNYLTGGNIFNGSLTVTNNSTQQLRFASTVGDSIYGHSIFNLPGTGSFRISYNGNSFFDGNVTINNTTAGSIVFGESNGTTTITSGNALLTSGFTTGTLTIRRVTQLGTTSNGTFSPSAVTVFQSNFGGPMTINSSGSLTFSATSFLSTGTFSGTNITMTGANSFSTVSGSTSITKTGGTDDSWAGGNTFGNLVVNNNTSNRTIILANSTADTYLGNATFNHNGTTGGIHIARSGINNFAGNITINNTTGGTIQFCGTAGGQAVIASGGALLTEGFTAGTLTLRRVTQNGNAANGSFQPATFNANPNNNFGGNISVVCSGILTIQTSLFKASNVFTGSQVILNGANSLSAVSGNTIITKTGATNNSWAGGNTFGALTVNNNSTAILTLANTVGDTYQSTAVFNKNNTGNIQISRSGTNTFAGNVTINNSSSGTINFGINNGTSTIASGYALLTDGFTAGDLVLRRVTQNGSTANGSFAPVNFSATLNNNIQGDISVVASGVITITSSSFRRTNTFTAPSINVTNACNFSTTSGTTTFTKTGTANNDWAGGNTFGNVVFNMNAASGRLRLANSTLDTYNGTATFLRNAAGELQPAYNGNNVFTGDISTVGTVNPITFAANNGRVFFQGSSAQTISGDVATKPVMRRITLNKSSASNTVTLNVPLDVSTNITFTSGRLVSSATNLLTILNAATVTGASHSSYVRGPVRKVGNQIFTFPIGDGGFYGPIGISAPSDATHHFTAQYFKESPDSLGLDTDQLVGTLNHVSGCENWDLSRTNGSSNVHVTLHWDETRCGGVNVLSELSVGKWNGSEWIDLGNGVVTGTTSLGSIRTQNVVTSFSPFTIASTTANNALPITLVSFEVASLPNNTVEVNWTTASERDNDFFTVERSLDGFNWEVVTTVQGQAYSIHNIDYSIIDPMPFIGVSYYRLKQTDYNGQFEYFDPKSVFVEQSDVKDIGVYPNPAVDVLRVYGEQSEIEQLVLVNSLGDRKSVV